MRLGLQARYSLIMVSLLVAMVGIMAGVHLLEFRATVTRTTEATKSAVAGALAVQLRRQGEGLARFLADTLADPIHGRRAGLIRDLVRAASDQEGVVYVVVLDGNHREIAASRSFDAYRKQVTGRPDVKRAMAAQRIATFSDNGMLHVMAPIVSGGMTRGCVKIALTLDMLNRDIEAVGSRMQGIAVDTGERFLFLYVIAALAIVTVGLGVSLLMVRGLVRPIRALSRFTRRIGTGDYVDPPMIDRSDELGDLGQAIGQMAENLEQVSQVSRLATLGEMAVSMAHELTQPLNTIRLAADNALLSMKSTVPDPDFETAKLGIISDQAARMGELIQRMCVVGRSEGPVSAFDPREPVRDAFSLLASQFADDEITVTLDLADECVRVLGRRNELGQVIINLLTNARDAIVANANDRSGSGRPPSGRIDIRLESERAGVVIEVKDNGGGIPADVLHRVFDPFFTTKDVTKGTGLGLSISFGIVNAMGGRITVRNFGGGAVFRVHLPRAQASARGGGANGRHAADG